MRPLCTPLSAQLIAPRPSGTTVEPSRHAAARALRHVADGGQAHPPAVGVIDPNPTSPWRNNYGVWVDEFEARRRAPSLPVIHQPSPANASLRQPASQAG